MKKTNIRLVSAIAAVLWCAAAAMGGDGAVRAVRGSGDRCWTVGDRGLILSSADGGLTWRRAECPVRANWQAACIDGNRVWLVGGTAVRGHPLGAGVGVVVRTDDEGKTFHRAPGTGPGWLYGGSFDRETIMLFGQANAASPGGLWRTLSGGQIFTPVPLSSTGYLRGGDFVSTGKGYVVGERNRIVSVQRLSELPRGPASPDSSLPLRAACLSGDGNCWAVGENGLVLHSVEAAKPWAVVALPLPAGTRRMADFEAVAADSNSRVWIAGGMLGVILYSANGGADWQLLPAPSPGAVDSLAYLGGDTLLAGGSGGRIWRSADGGKNWKLVHGGEAVDVLFILGAADRSAYPAIVAHSAAGCETAVVHATLPRDIPFCPPDQPLRAAAAQAGADDESSLGDFLSVAVLSGSGDLTDKQVVAAWAAVLDIPPEAEMVRQLAAAIRLYRPAVLAIGPEHVDMTGAAAENNLVARLARQAAALAAREGALPELAAAGLRPWSVKRIFAAQELNESWQPPWEEPDTPIKSRTTTVLDCANFPAGRGTSLEMLSQEAIWMTPWSGVLDRAGRICVYHCQTEANRLPLFTTGLTAHKLDFDAPDPDRRTLASSAVIAMAVKTKRTATAIAPVAAMAGEPDALAADRLLILWSRLLDEGRLAEADQARDAFIASGMKHPLYQRICVLGLAQAASAEVRAQAALRSRVDTFDTNHLAQMAQRFSAWTDWSTTAPGRMLLAKAWLAAGRGDEAKKSLGALAADMNGRDWQRCAAIDLAAMAGVASEPKCRILSPSAVPSGTKVDEALWAKVQPGLLTGRDPNDPNAGPPGSIQALRTPEHVILCLTLPQGPSRVWEVDIAADADRDCWTQIAVHCDSLGKRSVKLLLRDGPSATLDETGFAFRGRTTDKDCIIEVAMPLGRFGADPAFGASWLLQVRAVSRDRDGRRTLYFQPQPDDRLLPERYGLLVIPPPESPPAPAVRKP